MLVLSRKKNESIVINDDVTVTVVEIRGDKVRLGIEAPKTTTVHRQEIYDKIGATPKVAAGERKEERGTTEGTESTEKNEGERAEGSDEGIHRVDTPPNPC